MLKNAKNYEQELQKKLRDTWYDLDYQFYHSGSYHGDIDLSNDDLYAFVSVNDKDEIIGFFSYRINRAVNCARQFGALSFDIGNLIFARDLSQAIDDIFNKYHFNRMEWCCIDGNPVLDTYKSFCERHGGEVVAHEHECVRTIDGQLRDSWTFEILARNYISQKEDKEEIDTLDVKHSLGRQLAEVLARRLDGRQYREELTTKDLAWARDNGLVIVYGASDDLLEIDGIFCDEFECYGGGEICFTRNGPGLDKNMVKNVIKAVWCKEGIIPSYSWIYETDIPHSTFNIMDGNDYYCQGIVFSIDDLR